MHITCREISPVASCTVESAAAIFSAHPSYREGNTWFPNAFCNVAAFANVPESMFPQWFSIDFTKLCEFDGVPYEDSGFTWRGPQKPKGLQWFRIGSDALPYRL